MPEQKPSVGRIVHYFPDEFYIERTPSQSGPFAALITQVHEDDSVDLTVFLNTREEHVHHIKLDEGTKTDEVDTPFGRQKAYRIGYYAWPERV